MGWQWGLHNPPVQWGGYSGAAVGTLSTPLRDDQSCGVVTWVVRDSDRKNITLAPNTSTEPWASAAEAETGTLGQGGVPMCP